MSLIFLWISSPKFLVTPSHKNRATYLVTMVSVHEYFCMLACSQFQNVSDFKKFIRFQKYHRPKCVSGDSEQLSLLEPPPPLFFVFYFRKENKFSEKNSNMSGNFELTQMRQPGNMYPVKYLIGCLVFHKISIHRYFLLYWSARVDARCETFPSVLWI